MKERLFGLETEYAFSAVGGGDCITSGESLADALIEKAKEKFPYLPETPGAESGGIFLQNGSRFYKDAGEHPEIGCCEVTNPWDAVRYLLAGDRLLAELVSDYQKAHSNSEAVASRCNVDYQSRTTWGCHESYLHRADPDSFPSQILPFLASRVIFTGAGGFNPFSPGLEFVLSPRSFFLVEDISESSTSNRPLYHTKDETLSNNGWHRLHLLGESTCSETATWLKVGSTALVVAMIEGGMHPASNVKLCSPVDALHTFASDTSCTAPVSTETGKLLTAIEIQRPYLCEAEKHMHDSFMPPWSEGVCRRWRKMLEMLEQGAPHTVTRTLDWGIKLALYTHHVERRGFSWQSLRDWTYVLKRIVSALQSTEYHNKRVNVEFVLGKNSPPPVATEIERLSAVFLPNRGLSRDSLRRFLTLREEMFELDARFSQLGDKGVFAAMDRAGVLSHHVAGVNDISRAVAYPPAGTRAHLRGQCVRQFSDKEKGRFSCNWNGVWDSQSKRMLDLSEPFATRAQWQAVDDDDESLFFMPGHERQLRELFLSQVRARRSADGHTADREA